MYLAWRFEQNDNVCYLCGLLLWILFQQLRSINVSVGMDLLLDCSSAE